jgi:hypothetical protein
MEGSSIPTHNQQQTHDQTTFVHRRTEQAPTQQSLTAQQVIPDLWNRCSIELNCNYIFERPCTLVTQFELNQMLAQFERKGLIYAQVVPWDFSSFYGVVDIGSLYFPRKMRIAELYAAILNTTPTFPWMLFAGERYGQPQLNARWENIPYHQRQVVHVFYQGR